MGVVLRGSDAAAVDVIVDDGGNCGPPRWRTSCTRSPTRNMDSPGRCMVYGTEGRETNKQPLVKKRSSSSGGFFFFSVKGNERREERGD